MNTVKAERVNRRRSNDVPGRRDRGGQALPPSFAELLRAQSENITRSKGQRTRDSLIAAAADLLEERGYRSLRVSDINERAEVSNALFYVYFKNKDMITGEVMTAFVQSLYAIGEERAKSLSTEESIYRANYDYSRRFAANPGLMRCLIQFGDEIPEFGRMWQNANRQWTQRVVTRLSREPELKRHSPDELWTAATALGTMMDGFLGKLYIDKEPATLTRVRAVAPDDAALARFLTNLWVRGIFNRDMKWWPAAVSR